MRLYKLRNFYHTSVPSLDHSTASFSEQYLWLYMVIYTPTPIYGLGMLCRICYENDIAKRIP